MTQVATRSRTLLIVDDEPAILRLLVEALEKPEWNVLTATSGVEAIGLYRQYAEEIDMVLMDLKMSPSNGFVIMNELRRMNPQVRVAIMSGSPGEVSVDEMLEAGAVSVIPKPFLSLSNLSTALRQIVEAEVH
jgi:CheY-like chemotaxis protein